jgi:hypothetical protein
VLRALKHLIQEQKLIRFRYGAYARARINRFDGKLYPDGDTAENIVGL